MQTTLPWIIGIVSGFAGLALACGWALTRPSRGKRTLPSEWALAARPVFSADERRVYRLLKDALPHHIVLSKLPLVRFCQPTEAKQVRYWFDLLGAIHVGFAICSPNGRVLAAIDLESERNVSGRSLQIKQSVLGACRVRYLRYQLDNMPSAAELQLLVPFSNLQSRSPQAAPAPPMAAQQAPRRAAINSETPRRSSNAVGIGRGLGHELGHGLGAASSSLWKDSAVFQDSFFAPQAGFDEDTVGDVSRPGRSTARSFQDSHLFAEVLRNAAYDPGEASDEAPDEIVGIVIDSPRYGTRGPR